MTRPDLHRQEDSLVGCSICVVPWLHSAPEKPSVPFGSIYPNYDAAALAAAVCQTQGWELEQVRFYTGVPSAAENAFWNHFWSAKLLAMSRTGAYVFSRSLRYRNKTVPLPGGQQHTFLVGEEKGIDVRIAIDVVRLAGRNQYDVAVIFSQDQDLSGRRRILRPR